jgi:hypothetical protein
MEQPATTVRLAAIAEQHLRTPTDELEVLIEVAWNRVHHGEELPLRGRRREFWRGIVDRVSVKAYENRLAISLLVGEVAREVIDWAAANGLDVTQNETFLGLIVALCTQAVLEQMGERRHNLERSNDPRPDS